MIKFYIYISRFKIYIIYIIETKYENSDCYDVNFIIYYVLIIIWMNQHNEQIASLTQTQVAEIIF